MSVATTRQVAVAPIRPRIEGTSFVGMVLGGYRLVVELGRGGMGVVYYAEHVQRGDRAAVKVLLPEVAQDPWIVTRFFDEARAANAIRHPGIVLVLGAGEAEGLHYLVMELLEGETLGARIERKPPLAWRESVDIIVEASAALAAAHARGIVHRDLKPENLFLPAARGPHVPRVKVLDFGIAKLVGRDSVTRTRTGTVLGTPTYMSPEQCVGDRELDARSDVYALGVILYELLAGEVPFAFEAIGRMIVAHLQMDPPPISASRRIPPAIEAVVRRALEKKPQDRPPSAVDLAVELNDALDARPAARAPHLRLAGLGEGVDAADVARIEAVQSKQVGSSLAELVQKRIAQGTLVLPAMPRAVFDAIELLRSGAAFSRIARTIGTDPLVVSRLLRAANAAESAGAQPAETVLDALTRLGADRVRSILTGVAARQVFVSKDPRIQRAFTALWDHSVAVGVIARELAGRSPVAETAYLAGLLHDVGKPVVAAILLENEKLLLGELAGPWMGETLWRRTIETCHRTVGVELARRWCLPPVVVEVIERGDHFAGPTSAASWVTYGNALAERHGLAEPDVDVERAAGTLIDAREHLGGSPDREDAALAAARAPDPARLGPG